MTATTSNPARGVAWTAGGAFAAFYIFYAAAPVTFANTSPGPGVRVAVVMLIVVAVQPLVLITRQLAHNRRYAVLASVTAMGLGSAVMPLAGHWPGQILLAIGFGIFVVTSTAWVKEAVAPGDLGHALGIYGFGSAIGGALGAPIGLYLVNQFGLNGVATAGAALGLAALLPATRVTPVPPSGAFRLGNMRRAAAATPADEAESSRSGYAVASIGLAGHLLAVTIYASVLSGLSELHQSQGNWLIVGSAFAIQASLAAGRLAGGAITDRWSPTRAGIPAFVLLAISTAGFVMSTAPTLVLGSGILVGFASGLCQTAALASLMHRANNTARVNKASAAWNICFDIGLGAGALTSGQLPRR